MLKSPILRASNDAQGLTPSPLQDAALRDFIAAEMAAFIAGTGIRAE
jgi:hypothetical protein